jgi:hypothetical protein
VISEEINDSYLMGKLDYIKTYKKSSEEFIPKSKKFSEMTSPRIIKENLGR